jgi:hypothetical protein
MDSKLIAEALRISKKIIESDKEWSEICCEYDDEYYEAIEKINLALKEVAE